MRVLLILGLGVAGLALAALVFVEAGWVPADAIAVPPAWESALGQHALKASLARRAAGLQPPFAPDDPGVLRAGMKTFRQNCAGCHGTAGADSPWGAHDFYPRVPQIWRQPVGLTPAQAYVAVRDGVRYTGMGAWRGLMSDREIWQVADFVSHMPHLPPELDREWKAPPKPGG